MLVLRTGISKAGKCIDSMGVQHPIVLTHLYRPCCLWWGDRGPAWSLASNTGSGVRLCGGGSSSRSRHFGAQKAQKVPCWIGNGGNGGCSHKLRTQEGGLSALPVFPKSWPKALPTRYPLCIQNFCPNQFNQPWLYHWDSCLPKNLILFVKYPGFLFCNWTIATNNNNWRGLQNLFFFSCETFSKMP